MRSTHARRTAQPSCGSRAAAGAAAGSAAAPKALLPGGGFCESKRTRPVAWPVP